MTAAGAALALAGCGGSQVPPGRALAAKACHSSGTTAADLASQAAAANDKYAKLAADEHAAAASEATQNNELGGGNGALVGALSIGSSNGDQVLTDCVSLGLPVANSQ